MLWLSVQGMALPVISAVQNRLQKGGSSEMDSALVRYFVTGILEIVLPPLSLPFVRALGSLLMERSCIDALKSQHFDRGKMSQLIQLLGAFDATFSYEKGSLLDDDESLLSMLMSAYLSSKLHSNNKMKYR